MGRRQLAKKKKQQKKEDGRLYKTMGCVCLILLLMGIFI